MSAFPILQNHRTITLMAILLLMLLSIMKNTAYALDNLGSKITITKSGLVLNQITKTFDGTVTITNISTEIIVAPLTLTITNITSPNVAVYQSDGVDSDGNFLIQVYVKNGIIAPGEKAIIPIRFINPAKKTFGYSVMVSGSSMNSNNSTQVQVNVYSYSGDQNSPIDRSAGAGVSIYVNGIARAVTDSFGTAVIQVPLDTDEISAQRVSTTEGGSTTVQLTKNTNNNVDIVIVGDKEIYGTATLQIDQVNQLLLSKDFSILTLRLLDNNKKTIKINKLLSVELVDDSLNSEDMTYQFKLNKDGSASNLTVLSSKILYASPGKLTLKIVGVDSNGIPYINEAPFYIAGNKVSGTLIPSPSFPKLNVSNIRIVGKIFNTDIVVSTISDATGHFNFPNLPDGTLVITSKTLQNGSYYLGNGFFNLTGTKDLKVNMLTAVDLSGKNSIQQVTASQQLVKSNSLKQNLSLDTIARGATLTSASVMVSSDDSIAPSEQMDMLKIPKGTKYVKLIYKAGASTDVAGSKFPWKINVLAGTQGKPLFEKTSSVVSEETKVQVLDVATLAKDNDIDLTLSANAPPSCIDNEDFDCSDQSEPVEGEGTGVVTISAMVTLDVGFSITKVFYLPDDWDANNDGTYYSIPPSGKKNVFNRYFELDIFKPEGTTIDKVKVELLGAGDNSLIVEEKPGANITLTDENTIRVLATFKPIVSSVNSNPPLSDSIKYRFTVTGKDNKGNPISDYIVVPNQHPLWRMPPGFDRYGERDLGGDDWCAKGTYNWMLNNKDKLQAINDISGEHGKYINHQSHAKGTDIDMYHFHLFLGADAKNGTSNYEQLVARINDLPKLTSRKTGEVAIGQTAKLEIINWITKSRAGIDKLAALDTVSKVIYASNAPGGPDIAMLLKTGEVTVGETKFNLGTGRWENKKHSAKPPQHHHHVHISLDPRKLN